MMDVNNYTGRPFIYYIFINLIIHTEGTTTRIDDSMSLMESQITQLHDSVLGCVSSCLDVLGRGDEAVLSKKHELEKKRDAEWAEFVAEMDKAREEVLAKHKERMSELDAEMRVDKDKD